MIALMIFTFHQG